MTNDADDFREAMRDVTPLARADRVEPPRRARAPRPRARRPERDAVLADSLTMAPEAALLETGEELLYRQPSVGERAWRKLRRGGYTVQGELDLHGLSVARAQTELRSFLAEAARDGVGCVRIVHGKGTRSGPGGPVLKPQVDRWLRQWDDVLAFASAPPRDGGTGAVYVLLRRR
jgi:DNA-nicking Smr family endonuclease